MASKVASALEGSAIKSKLKGTFDQKLYAPFAKTKNQKQIETDRNWTKNKNAKWRKQLPSIPLRSWECWSAAPRLPAKKLWPSPFWSPPFQGVGCLFCQVPGIKLPRLPRPEPSLISSLRPGRKLAAQLAEEQHGIRPPNVAWAWRLKGQED